MMTKKVIMKTSLAAPFGATDLRINVFRYDTRQLHWAELQVIPTEQALWRRLDDALGELRWRMMFSMLEGQMICSLSHVDAGIVITRQGYSPRTDNAGISFFLAALRAAQMFGVGAELQGLPHIAVGLRQSDLSGRTVKDCFHVSRVDYEGSEIGGLEICDQYRRPRWPKTEDVQEGEPQKTVAIAVSKEKKPLLRQSSEQPAAEDGVMIRRIAACHTQPALMELFNKQPRMVDRPDVFDAIRNRMYALKTQKKLH